MHKVLYLDLLKHHKNYIGFGAIKNNEKFAVLNEI